MNRKLIFRTLKRLKQTKKFNILNIRARDSNIITNENKIRERWEEYTLQNDHSQYQNGEEDEIEEINEEQKYKVLEKIKQERQ